MTPHLPTSWLLKVSVALLVVAMASRARAENWHADVAEFFSSASKSRLEKNPPKDSSSQKAELDARVSELGNAVDVLTEGINRAKLGEGSEDDAKIAKETSQKISRTLVEVDRAIAKDPNFAVARLFELVGDEYAYNEAYLKSPRNLKLHYIRALRHLAPDATISILTETKRQAESQDRKMAATITSELIGEIEKQADPNENLDSFVLDGFVKKMRDVESAPGDARATAQRETPEVDPDASAMPFRLSRRQMDALLDLVAASNKEFAPLNEQATKVLRETMSEEKVASLSRPFEVMPWYAGLPSHLVQLNGNWQLSDDVVARIQQRYPSWVADFKKAHEHFESQYKDIITEDQSRVLQQVKASYFRLRELHFCLSMYTLSNPKGHLPPNLQTLAEHPGNAGVRIDSPLVPRAGVNAEYFYVPIAEMKFGDLSDNFILCYDFGMIASLGWTHVLYADGRVESIRTREEFDREIDATIESHDNAEQRKRLREVYNQRMEARKH